MLKSTSDVDLSYLYREFAHHNSRFRIGNKRFLR